MGSGGLKIWAPIASKFVFFYLRGINMAL